MLLPAAHAHFHAQRVDVSSSAKPMVCKASRIYSLVLYRKKIADPWSLTFKIFSPLCMYVNILYVYVLNNGVVLCALVIHPFHGILCLPVTSAKFFFLCLLAIPLNRNLRTTTFFLCVHCINSFDVTQER